MKTIETKRPRVVFDELKSIEFEDYREAAKFLTLLSCAKYADEGEAYDLLVKLVPGYEEWRDSDINSLGTRFVPTDTAAKAALRLLCHRYGLALAEDRAPDAEGLGRGTSLNEVFANAGVTTERPRVTEQRG